MARRGVVVLAENKKYRRCRPLSLRKRLYRRVLELRGQGLSYRKIQKRILEETGEYLNTGMISFWVRRVHTPYGDGVGESGEDQRTHKLKPCPELAYVIAAGLGDGTTNRDVKHHDYMVILAVRDYDFAEEFGRCAAMALGREKPYRPYWVKSLRCWVTKAYSKELYELLRKPDLEKIRPYIVCSKECMAAFLRGLADAEGNANKNEKSLGHVSIYNSDLRLIEYAGSLLRALGIFAKVYERREKKTTKIDGRIVNRRRQITYNLWIYRKVDIIKFREIIGFAIKRKQEILERVQ